jgi:hypothetical protein
MNLAQVHERLRLELLRRIQRGTLSVSLLARQTGFGQPHLSNFLHGRRQLSLEGMDRVLGAQHLLIADLLPAAPLRAETREGEASGAVPLVSHAAALFEPNIRPAAVQSMLHFPMSLLEPIRPRASHARRAWERFVAVRVDAEDAPAMEPLVQPEAIALIDRHYNSLAPYRAGRPNLYAVRHSAHLRLRYVDMVKSLLVLRPHNVAFPVELIEMDEWDSHGEPLTGRVALLLNQL